MYLPPLGAHYHSKILNILAKMTQDSLRLTNIKPLETKHTFTTTQNVDGLALKSDSFKDRIRQSQVSGTSFHLFTGN